MVFPIQDFGSFQTSGAGNRHVEVEVNPDLLVKETMCVPLFHGLFQKATTPFFVGSVSVIKSFS